MKLALSLVTICLFFITANAQTRTISRKEYEKIFELAVWKTNKDYPVVFKVTTQFIEHGKTARTVTDWAENQAPLQHRLKRTIVAGGRTTNMYQVSAESRKVFCSDDGVSWKVSDSECWGPTIIYGARKSESTKHTVTVKTLKGKTVRVYREYSVFGPYEGYEKKEFRETISTIDSRGFFRTVVNIEGTLHPRTVTLIRKQSWVTKARIKPVVPPVKEVPGARTVEFAATVVQ